MSKVFVKCHWRILKFDKDDFLEILRLAEVLECELGLEEDYIFVDGYQVITIFVSADAVQIVKIFREAIQRYAHLSHVSVSKPKNALTRLPIVTGMLHLAHQIRNVMYFLETAAVHNQHVRDHRPIWILAAWIIKPISKSRLQRTAEMAQAEGLSITYKIMGKTEVQFFIKFQPPYEFAAFMTKLKKVMTFRHWTVVFKRQSYQAVDYDDKIEAYPQFTHDTIPAFLEAIKPYL